MIRFAAPLVCAGLAAASCATPAVHEEAETRARAAERTEAPSDTWVVPHQVDLDPRPEPTVPAPQPRPRGPEVESRTPGTPLSPTALPETPRGDATPAEATIAPERLRLLDDVRASIARNGAPARELDVRLDGDVLVLSGDVDTEQDKAAVEELARAKAGAAEIRNELVVREK